MSKDQRMIRLIKKENEAGLKLLINEYAGLLKSILQKQLAALPEQQDECLNDVLLAIWENIDKYDKTKSSFKNWICTITKYRAINYLKKYRHDLNVIYWEEEKHQKEYAHTDAPLEKELWKIQLDELLEPLSKQDKQLFKEYFDSPHSAETIAEKNDLTRGALYSRISRGKRKIRNFFNKGGINHDERR